jgi:polyferredoxin
VAAVFWLLGMFYLFPWLSWDGRQAVLFDLPARKFHVFGLTFWPQDFVFLAMLLIIAALALFFFTALAGRLWCGYACPQTVWTEVFLWMERIEGDRHKRMKLDAGPWDRTRSCARAASTCCGCCSRCGPASPSSASSPRSATSWRALSPFDWGGWETFWVLFYALATWGNAGFLREQVCKYMCPYARFQSAMFDRNTLIIAYDPMRGEPRGPRKRGLASVLERGARPAGCPHRLRLRVPRQPPSQPRQAQAHARGTITFDGAPRPSRCRSSRPTQLGDCIDCTICVQVCPTGIDIRNGLQYECIACGACIDACDEVMDKVGYPQWPDPLLHAERHRRQADARAAPAHHRLRHILLALMRRLGVGRDESHRR